MNLIFALFFFIIGKQSLVSCIVNLAVQCPAIRLFYLLTKQTYKNKTWTFLEYIHATTSSRPISFANSSEPPPSLSAWNEGTHYSLWENKNGSVLKPDIGSETVIHVPACARRTASSSS
jgi:hypothetical protein